MSEREKKIFDMLCAKLPKLSNEKKERALGVMEGMAIMADLSARAEAAPAPAQIQQEGVRA